MPTARHNRHYNPYTKTEGTHTLLFSPARRGDRDMRVWAIRVDRSEWSCRPMSGFHPPLPNRRERPSSITEIKWKRYLSRWTALALLTAHSYILFVHNPSILSRTRTPIHQNVALCRVLLTFLLFLCKYIYIYMYVKVTLRRTVTIFEMENVCVSGHSEN